MRQLCIAFPCAIQSTANTTRKRLRQTKRPTNPAGKCTFRCNVYFSNNKRRWFFKKQGGGCSTHIGHSKSVDPKQMKASSATADANKADDDMNAQGLVNNMNNYDDNLGGGSDKEEDDDDSPAAKRPYAELMPTFVSITDLVQTEGDLAFVRKDMNRICSAMLKRKNKAGPVDNMVTLPEVDQRRKDKRIKPMRSPEKR
jgi:hypothetical protein